MTAVQDKASVVLYTMEELWKSALGRSQLEVDPGPVRFLLAGGALLGAAAGAGAGILGVVAGCVLGAGVITVSLGFATLLVRAPAKAVNPETVKAVRLRLQGAKLAQVDEGPGRGQVTLGWEYDAATVQVLDEDGREIPARLRPPLTYQVVAYLRAADLIDARAVQRSQSSGEVDVYGYIEPDGEKWAMELAELGVSFPAWERQVISEIPAVAEE